MVHSEQGSPKKVANCSLKMCTNPRGYIAGPGGPVGGGGVGQRERERLPLVVSRTVGSARCADPIIKKLFSSGHLNVLNIAAITN